jgi:hypothetical protein
MSGGVSCLMPYRVNVSSWFDGFLKMQTGTGISVVMYSSCGWPYENPCRPEIDVFMPCMYSNCFFSPFTFHERLMI